jgi:hypothetical protein
VANSHCTDKTRPVCAGQQCVPCSRDKDCPVVTDGHGLCIADGHCAGADELIYVQNVAACGANDGGTSDHPFCTSAQGVAALMASRSILILRGVIDPFSISGQLVGPTFMTVIGQDATVNAGGMTGVAIRDAAKVDIRALRITGGTQGGIAVTGGSTLLLDRSRIDKVMQIGILIDASAYRITNTMVTESGSFDTISNTYYPAVAIRNSLGQVPALFSHNTVASNVASLSCDAAYPIVASILTPSTVPLGSTCDVTPCCNATLADFSGADNFHLSAGSGCLDQLKGNGGLDVDIDGDPRPSMIMNDYMSDCGADEYKK